MKFAGSIFFFAITLVPSFASAQASSRDWCPATPGLEIQNTAKWDAAEGTFEINAGGDAVVPVLKDTKPDLSPVPYQVTGEVRYENVGTGFLEMWSHFPPIQPGLPGGSYFSRTLGEMGPMQKLEGSSGWRSFLLPFDPAGASGPPTRLELNIVLPDGGTVWLRKVRLLTTDRNDWSNPAIAGRTIGLIGGVAGATIGILSSLIGFCLRKGSGSGVVSTAIITMVAVAIAGGTAIIWISARSHLWWALGVGLILLIMPVVYALKWRKTARLAFAERELQRMQAADA
jgi:hypothetical protein